MSKISKIYHGTILTLVLLNTKTLYFSGDHSGAGPWDRNGLGGTASTEAGSMVQAKPSSGRRGAASDFVGVPPSLEIWEKAIGAKALLTQIRDVAAVSRFTPQEMAEIALEKSDFLAATAVLGDQARAGSPEQNFADLVMRSVKQGILDSLPAAMAELEKFSRKNEFQGRQLDWVKFLAGATVSCFAYPNCQAFREDSDANLESKHDYVQIIFPSWRPSDFANRDLYIRDNEETWKALLRECPTVKRSINLNIQLNAIRMLHFWGFKFAFTRDAPNAQNVDRVFVVLEDNPNSPLHRNGDHNTLRATRFIEALEMFGCFNGLLKIFAEGLLPKYYSKHPSYSYWQRAWENTSRLF